MINAGAILICSLLKTLVKPEMTLAEKFDFTLETFQVWIFLPRKFVSDFKLNQKSKNFIYSAENGRRRQFWIQQCRISVRT